MKIAATFLVLAVVGVWGSAIPKRPGGKIVGGTDAEPGQCPSQVSLRLNGVHGCGGSILDHQWVLTVAQCIIAFAEESTTALVGTVDANVGGDVHQAVQFVRHAGFDENNTGVNDIALIRVNPTFDLANPLIQTVTLPAQGDSIAEGATATIIGWGRTTVGGPGPASPILQTAAVVISNQAECQQAYSGIDLGIYGTQVCAGLPEEGVGGCNFDSGGTLFVDGVAVGLMSFSQGCAQPGSPAVYTRVASYIDWIAENQNKNFMYLRWFEQMKQDIEDLRKSWESVDNQELWREKEKE